jgi:AcrR family transcriptional regulator
MPKVSSTHVERTKHFFKSAFISLVHEKGFSAVTVKDIVERAEYNRTTFYLYYKDKFDLVDELYKEMSENIQFYSISKYEHNNNVAVRELNKNSFELLYFIYDHRDYFKLLCVADTIPHIHTQLPNSLYHVLTTQFTITYNFTGIDDATQKRYMAYGTAGIIMDWIHSDFQQSPAEVTKQLIQIFQTFAKGFIISDSPS